MMWLQYKNENSAGAAAIEDQENEEDDKEDEARETSLVETIVNLGNLFIIMFIGVGYPTAVLPIYLAETTSEYVVVITRIASRLYCVGQKKHDTLTQPIYM